MDPELLVEQKAGGQRLIEQLLRDGFPVSVVFWVRTSEGGLWNLYIASPEVAEKWSNDVYRKFGASMDRVSSKHVTLVDVKLLNERDPIATAVIELRDALPGQLPSIQPGKSLGPLSIKELYIYPEIAGPRLSFTVAYRRNGDPNHWTAAIQRGEFYRGMKAKGAVSYTTAGYAEETPADQGFAMVGVLVNLDPRLNRPDLLDQPDWKRMTADQARKAADEMFKSHHPDAVIEHDLDEEDVREPISILNR